MPSNSVEEPLLDMAGAVGSIPPSAFTGNNMTTSLEDIFRLSAEACMAKHKAKKKPQDKIEKVMHEFKEGSLHSGSKKGPVVTNKKQAIAIAISEKKRGKK